MDSRSGQGMSQNLLPASRYGRTAQFKAYSKEEERKLYDGGEYWALILNCGPWIWYCCKRWTEEHLADLYQAALLDMYEHIDNYDYNKGRFSTWAVWRIRNFAPRWLVRQKEIYVPLRPRFPKPEYSDEKIDIPDQVDDSVGWLTPQVLVTVREIVGDLSDREQLVYKLLCAGYNNVEIGKRIKVTRERARQLILTLIMRIKKTCLESKELSSLLSKEDYV